MTLVAAITALLYRYTAQEDVVIGGAIANRDNAEVEGLIGLFVNMVVLRTQLGGDPTFRQLMWRVREVTLQAYAHRDLPLERLVEEFRPDRKTNRQPLFQVALVFQNAPVPRLELLEPAVSSVEINTRTAQFELTFFMAASEQGLIVNAGYSTDLFNASTIRRMLEDLRVLIEEVSDNPDQRILGIRLSSDDDSTLEQGFLSQAMDECEEFDFHA
jgi:non-ribosomal peptide synthetase component F